MSRKDRRIARVALFSALIGVSYFLLIFSSHLMPTMSDREILRVKIPLSTQVVRVAEAQHFFDIELENQKTIEPEEFLKKMKRGEFKVVFFPKSSSAKSFRTIGFGDEHVYVVKEREWEDWFWKNFKSSKSFFPYDPYDVKIKKEDSQLMLVIGYERKSQILSLPLCFTMVFAASVIATFFLVSIIVRDLIYPDQSS